MRLLSWNVKFNTLPKNLPLVVKAIGFRKAGPGHIAGGQVGARG